MVSTENIRFFPTRLEAYKKGRPQRESGVLYRENE